MIAACAAFFFFLVRFALIEGSAEETCCSVAVGGSSKCSETERFLVVVDKADLWCEYQTFFNCKSVLLIPVGNVKRSFEISLHFGPSS